MSRIERRAWIGLGLLWAGYLVVRFADLAEPVERVGKALLMPALLVAIVAGLGRATPRWLVAGLALATVGDIAIDIRLEAGIVGFLAMQVCYIAGFLALGAWSGLRGRWAAPLGYAALWAVVNLLLGPQLGDLRLPVLVYSAVICAMASLAVGVGARVGVGAALFVVSDALIGVGEAGLDLPARAALVMPIYLVGQYLIATGWARRVRPEVRVPV